MAKKDRFNGAVEAFASQSTGLERTVFGDTAQSNDIDDNLNTDFFRGWGIVGPNDLPTKQDFNAMGYSFGYLLAYLYQQGVAEWNATQDYHLDNMVASGGNIYKSLQNNNTNHAVTDAVWWSVINSITLVTTQFLKTGTAATYNRPAGCKKIVVEMIGGGGGGGDTGGTAATAGGDTSFNSIVAKGGVGGIPTNLGARPAAAGNGTGTALLRIAGARGPAGAIQSPGAGACSFFGGAGAGTYNVTGTNAEANSGSGGGGGSTSNPSVVSAGGGDAGEYVVFEINNPAATYTYTIGAGGTGGQLGSSNTAGGNGGSGLIIVKEYY